MSNQTSEKALWRGFQPFYSHLSQIIRHIQIIVSDTKVNVHQCELLHISCIRLRDWLQNCGTLESNISESLCILIELVHVVQRAKYLIAECTHPETVFLDKTEEFRDLFDGMRSWLSLVNVLNDEKERVHPSTDLLEDAIKKDRNTVMKCQSISLPVAVLSFFRLWSLDLVMVTCLPLPPCSAYRNQLVCPSYLIVEDKFLASKGASHAVYKGKYFGMAVAAKEFEKSENRLEFQVIEKLTHPHLLQMFGWCEKINPSLDNGSMQPGRSIYCVTELMETDLKKYLEESPHPFAHVTAIDIMLQIGKAMSYLHKQGITHGNLASSNILVNANNSLLGHTPYFLVKVAGLPLSRNHDIKHMEVLYMAPERDIFGHADGMNELVDNKADVYSFGIICAEILTGKKLKLNIADRDKKPDLPPECPRDLQGLIHRCCERVPSTRPDFSEICEKLYELKRDIYPLVYVNIGSNSDDIYSSSSSSSSSSSRDDFISNGNEVGRISDSRLEQKQQISDDINRLIGQFQGMVNEATIYIHQCELLINMCKQASARELSISYEFWELGSLINRVILLMKKCKFVGTAFLDKTAEFKDIFTRFLSCYPDFVNEHEHFSVSKFQSAVDRDLEELLERTRDKKLRHAIISAIVKRGFLDPKHVVCPQEPLFLGKGNYGWVYIGQLFGMKVAVKAFKKTNDGRSETECEMMWEVARNHPHLLQMIDYYEIPKDRSYSESEIRCVTELMNTDLGKFLKGEKVPLITAIDIMSQIAEAMCYLHNHDIIHRDLKPQNILVNKGVIPCYPVVKVADFGLARIAPQSDFMTAPTGTHHYMAPEVQMESKYDKKVDVYSFGVMCKEILPSESRPIALTKLLDGCCEKTPQQRPNFDTICIDLKELKKGFILRHKIV